MRGFQIGSKLIGYRLIQLSTRFVPSLERKRSTQVSKFEIDSAKMVVCAFDRNSMEE